MIELGESWNDDGEAEFLFLDTSSSNRWVLWRQTMGGTREKVWALPPSEGFEDLQERYLDFYFNDWENLGIAQCVAYQDWDSGGPGAGAGRVSVYQVGDAFYVTHDAGTEGPYGSKKEAIERNGVDVVNDATVEIVGVDEDAKV